MNIHKNSHKKLVYMINNFFVYYDQSINLLLTFRIKLFASLFFHSFFFTLPSISGMCDASKFIRVIAKDRMWIPNPNICCIYGSWSPFNSLAAIGHLYTHLSRPDECGKCWHLQTTTVCPVYKADINGD
jgi:hypothetical protein